MEKIKAPFTQEQVDKLNEFQKLGKFHPFTCCSPDIFDCKRKKDEGETPEERQGILIASNEGWICPCGKYQQDWAYSFMIDN